MAGEVILLMSTFPDADAARGAVRAMLGEELIACGNLVPGVESIYRWKGAVEESREVLLICKTVAERVDAAQARLRELHPYEVPEILRVPVTGGWPAYLEWVEESCGLRRGGGPEGQV